MSSSCLKRLGPVLTIGRRRHLHLAARRHGTKSPVSANPFEAAEAVHDVAHDAMHTLLERSRLGVNDLLKGSLGLEVKRALPKQTPREASHGDRVPRGTDSSFWQPHSSYSPFSNRAKYLKQYERMQSADQSENALNSACTVVPLEEIHEYVKVLLEDGSLKSLYGMPAMFMPQSIYASLVMIALRTLQTSLGMVNGQSVLGRHLLLFKRHSMRGKLRVSKRLPVDDVVVHKLVARIMEDHHFDEIEHGLMGREMQRQMYHNVVTLIFRVVFDLVESFQLRCLGHSVTIHIQPDDSLADAPGWDIPLDQGIFGRFDESSKKSFADDLVTDLLKDDRINLPQVPDVLERKIYTNAVMVLLQLVETAGTHLELHVAAMAFRPATDEMVKESS